MPPDDTKDARSSAATSSSNAPISRYSVFTVPPPIKQLFNKFPLVTYPPNTLPLRAPPQNRRKHTLYVFTTPELVEADAPSYNPGCLKWQTVLKFHSIPFVTVPSSNHASPSGALPFLLTATPTTQSSTSSTTLPTSASHPLQTRIIPTSKLPTWLKTQTQPSPSKHQLSPPRENSRLAAYTTLLTPLRLAYLHALYLHPATFTALATPLYITPCSTNIFVQTALAIPLRAAALEQILLGAGGVGAPLSVVDVEGLYVRAEEALEALEALLEGCRWFGECAGWGEEGKGEEEEEQHEKEKEKQKGPQTVDASVFAYTHIILSLFASQPADTPAARLARALSAQRGLVEHRCRILKEYYVQQAEQGLI